jgi:hypothetical protein
VGLTGVGDVAGEESVWAYLLSLRVSVGEIISTDEKILSELNEIQASIPSFDTRTALKQLQRIGVVETDLVARAMSHLNAQAQTRARVEGI